MEVNRVTEETRRVYFSKKDMADAINQYLAHHHGSGLVTDIDSVVQLEDGIEFMVHADPLARTSEWFTQNPGNTLRATPAPTAAGEVPTASDVQRMANNLPPRLKP